MGKFKLVIDLDTGIPDDLPIAPNYKEVIGEFFRGNLKAGQAAKKINHSREQFEKAICALIIISIKEGNTKEIIEADYLE